MKTVNGTEYRMYRREFLNEEGHESIASVFATVGRTSSKKRWDYSEITLKFSDCSRIIDFSFDLSDQKGRENSLKKVEKMQEVLAEFQRALKAEAKVAATRDKREEERKKKEGVKKRARRRTFRELLEGDEEEN